MKKQVIFTVSLILALIFSQSAHATNFDCSPYHFVITERRIWIVADELPVGLLEVQISNEKGEVVIQKQFCSKTERWFLDLTNLPKGRYKVSAGDLEAEWDKK